VENPIRDTGFRFEKEHEFRLTPLAQGSAIAPEHEFTDIVITPDDSRSLPGIDQVGDVRITAHGGPEESRDLALSSARYLANRLTLEQGDFRLRIVVLMWKRIPETDAEATEIGDHPYGAQLSIQEIVPTPVYEPDERAEGKRADDPRLLAQFAAARRLSEPVSQFLGLYRILESVCHAGDGQSARNAFLNHLFLGDVFDSMETGEPYEEFVKSIVKVRNECAHLRLDSGFGFAPDDPRIRHMIVPRLQVLESLTRLAIMERGRRRQVDP
jgi:hypothetical protein